MTILREIKARGRDILMPVLGATVLFYFAYHAVQGERGLLTLWQLTQQMSSADAQLAVLQEKHDELAHRVSLLRPQTLDRDLLDERARYVLGLVGPNEAVIAE